MVKTDDFTIVSNWLEYNRKLAGIVKEQQEQERKKANENVRVADLKAVWDSDQKRRGTVLTEPQGVRVLDLKAVWDKEFNDRGGIADD